MSVGELKKLESTVVGIDREKVELPGELELALYTDGRGRTVSLGGENIYYPDNKLTAEEYYGKVKQAMEGLNYKLIYTGTLWRVEIPE